VSHCDADAAEQLDSFGDLVDELVLLLVVLVEEQMQLIKRRPATCQWCFLYKSRSVIVSASSWLRLSTLSWHTFSASAMGNFTKWPNGWISCACWGTPGLARFKMPSASITRLAIAVPRRQLT